MILFLNSYTHIERELRWNLQGLGAGSKTISLNVNAVTDFIIRIISSMFILCTKLISVSLKGNMTMGNDGNDDKENEKTQ